jgi:DNA-directed RNA polymerase beta subunit
MNSSPPPTGGGNLTDSRPFEQLLSYVLATKPPDHKQIASYDRDFVDRLQDLMPRTIDLKYQRLRPFYTRDENELLGQLRKLDDKPCSNCGSLKTAGRDFCGGKACEKKEASLRYMAKLARDHAHGMMDELDSKGCDCGNPRLKAVPHCGGSQCAKRHTTGQETRAIATYAKFADYVCNKILRVTFTGLKTLTPRLLTKSGSGETELLYPAMCEDLGESYVSVVVAEYQMHIVQLPHETESRAPERVLGEIKMEDNFVTLGRIPVMARGKLCNLREKIDIREDPSHDFARHRENWEMSVGGHFVVRGMPKVIMPIEVRAPNVIVTKRESSSEFTSEVYSTDSGTGVTTRLQLMLTVSQSTGEHSLFVTESPFGRNWPIVVLFWLLGVTSEVFLETVTKQTGPCGQMIAQQAVELARRFLQTDVLEDPLNGVEHEIKERNDRKWEDYKDPGMRQQYARHRLAGVAQSVKSDEKLTRLDELEKTRLFPHIRFDRDTAPGVWRTQKAAYLFKMTTELIHVAVNGKLPTDRDAATNKRVLLAGEALGIAWRHATQQAAAEVRRAWDLKLAKPIDMHKEAKELMRALWPDDLVTMRLLSPLTSGNWEFGRDLKEAGMSQPLDRLNKAATCSQLNALLSQLPAKTASIAARAHRGDYLGLVCPAFGPDGNDIGLTRNMAVTAVVSGYSDVKATEQCLRGLLRLPFPAEVGKSGQYCVFLNDAPIGNIAKDNATKNNLAAFREARRQQAAVLRECSMLVEEDQIRFYCGPGRMMRPLLVAQNGQLPFMTRWIEALERAKDLKIKTPQQVAMEKAELLKYAESVKPGSAGTATMLAEKWRLVHEANSLKPGIAGLQIEKAKLLKSAIDEGFSRGEIEYLDIFEMQNVYIAKLPVYINKDKYTHCEIHPVSMFGYLAGMVFNLNHVLPQRLNLETTYHKACAGFHVPLRAPGKRVMYLDYPQRPLFRNAVTEGVMPEGDCITSAVVAVMALGFNQEDSVIVKQSAIDRGLFRVTKMKRYTRTIDLKAGEIHLCPRDLDKGWSRPRIKYAKLESDGLPEQYARVNAGDAVIGVRKREYGGKDINGKDVWQYTDCSVFIPGNEGSGRVSFASLSKTGPAKVTAIVEVMHVSVPQVGDKVSIGPQKGVISHILREEDMPWTVDGITPDIILSPMAFVKRKTVSLLQELTIGKAVCMRPDSEWRNGTGYSALFKNGDPQQTHQTMASVSDSHATNSALEEYCLSVGMTPTGYERMYLGSDGRRVFDRVLIGVCSTRRLKHMVADKAQSRAKGAVDAVTGQPNAGRANNGGARCGEMEKDCIAAHGAPAVARDLLFRNSDQTETVLCSCGFTPNGPTAINGVVTSKQKLAVHDCKFCQDKEMRDFTTVYTSRAFLALRHELAAMGIGMRLITESASHHTKPSDPQRNLWIEELDGKRREEAKVQAVAEATPAVLVEPAGPMGLAFGPIKGVRREAEVVPVGAVSWNPGHDVLVDVPQNYEKVGRVPEKPSAKKKKKKHDRKNQKSNNHKKDAK